MSKVARRFLFRIQSRTAIIVFGFAPKFRLVPSPEEAVLELSNRLDSAHYYAEIDGTLNAIENAVDTDGELTEGNYRFKIT